MTPSPRLSRQNAHSIPAASSNAPTPRSCSTSAIHRGVMMVPFAFALSLLLLNPLVLSEVTSPAPVLRHIGIREIGVRVYARIRTGRGVRTGLVARPLRPLRCVPRPCGPPFRRRASEINRAVCTCAQTGVGNGGRRIARHVRCWGQYRSWRRVAMWWSAGFLVWRCGPPQIPIPSIPLSFSLTVRHRRCGMVRPVYPALNTSIPAPSAAPITRARRRRWVCAC